VVLAVEVVEVAPATLVVLQPLVKVTLVEHPTVVVVTLRVVVAVVKHLLVEQPLIHKEELAVTAIWIGTELAILVVERALVLTTQALLVKLGLFNLDTVVVDRKTQTAMVELTLVAVVAH
jgi:hypothetical protein